MKSHKLLEQIGLLGASMPVVRSGRDHDYVNLHHAQVVKAVLHKDRTMSEYYKEVPLEAGDVVIDVVLID